MTRDDANRNDVSTGGAGTTPHDWSAELVGAYVLGALDPAEAASVERHLADCPACRQEVTELRELETALGEVPPELLLDGPPEGGDLLLQRTLRRARTERGSALRRRRARIGTAAAVAAAAALVLGVVLGRTTAAEPPVAAGPPAGTATATATPPPAGTRTASATDPATGARMTLTMTPAMGWVRVNAAVTGIPAGQRCHLVVNGRSGAKADAGSWLVSPAASKYGTTLDGSAIVAPDDVTSVSVANESGQTFVTVPL